MGNSPEHRFLLFQMQEIQKYLQECSDDNSEQAVMRWIESNAARLRAQWEKKNLSI